MLFYSPSIFGVFRSVLYGWLISINEGPNNGLFVITALKKNVFHKTIFRLSNFLVEDRWVRIKRGLYKFGEVVQPLRRVLNDNIYMFTEAIADDTEAAVTLAPSPMCPDESSQGIDTSDTGTVSKPLSTDPAKVSPSPPTRYRSLMRRQLSICLSSICVYVSASRDLLYIIPFLFTYIAVAEIPRKRRRFSRAAKTAPSPSAAAERAPVRPLLLLCVEPSTRGGAGALTARVVVTKMSMATPTVAAALRWERGDRLVASLVC